MLVSSFINWKQLVLLGLMSPETAEMHWVRMLQVVHGAQGDHRSKTSSAPSPHLLTFSLLTQSYNVWKEMKKIPLDDFSKETTWWGYKEILSQCCWRSLRSSCTFLPCKRGGDRTGLTLVGLLVSPPLLLMPLIHREFSLKNRKLKWVINFRELVFCISTTEQKSMSPHYPSTDQGKLKAIAEMQNIKEFYCGSFVFETIFFSKAVWHRNWVVGIAFSSR